jgi:hypothetical protein
MMIPSTLEPLNQIQDIGLSQNLEKSCLEVFQDESGLYYIDHRKCDNPDQAITIMGRDNIVKMAFGNAQDRWIGFEKRLSFFANNFQDIRLPKVERFESDGRATLLCLSKVSGREMSDTAMSDENNFLQILNFFKQLTELTDKAKKTGLFHEQYSQKVVRGDQDVDGGRRWLIWPKLERNNIIINDKGLFFLNIEKVAMFSRLELTRQWVRYFQSLIPDLEQKTYWTRLSQIVQAIPEVYPSSQALYEEMIYFCERSDQYSYQSQSHKEKALPFLRQLRSVHV